MAGRSRKEPTTATYKRLGDYVKAARGLLGLSQQELARAAGLGESSIIELEKGQPRRRHAPTVSALERALRWEPGSYETILAGGEPARMESQAADPRRRVSVRVSETEEVILASLAGLSDEDERLIAAQIASLAERLRRNGPAQRPE